MNKKFYLLIAALISFTTIFAQHEQKVVIAKKYLQEKIKDWKLTEADINDISVDKAFVSEHNGVTHIYLRQRYQGIKIFNAINVINILPSGEVLYAAGNRFLPNITSKIITTTSRINPEMAIQQTAKHLEIKTTPILSHKKSSARNKFTFSNTNISNSDIKVEPIYQLMPDGKLHLAWQLAIDMMDKVDYWNVRVDALTGKVLSKNNWTSKCSFGAHNHTSNCGYLERQENHNTNTNAPFSFNNNGADNATYTVFAIPLESPAHGDRSTVTNPADPDASPFGWHDTDGIDGAEFTTTRGNNVHVYADVEDRNRTSNDEPDGGDGLIFNAPFNPDNEPIDNQDAAVIQLFYNNNVIHDVAYHYGFDERAGNFQEKHYVNSTSGDNDYVVAETLDGANQGVDDNATFSTPPDGSNGSMSMFVWNRGGNKVLQIIEPMEIARSIETNRASFGTVITDSLPVKGEVAIAVDGSGQPTFACSEIINKEEVNGKIAMIDRGDCFFVEKARNAQNAGAIAVVICNFENSLLSGGLGAPGNDPGNDINIPIVLIRSGDCQVLRQIIDEGLVLNFQIPESESTGPNQLDGGFDNGIVFHEFSHGISNRLTGGGGNTSCLFNQDGMGEGWSDFFTLVMAAEPGDQGTDKRGIGTYVLRQPIDGQGVRKFPYSTDMNVYPLTYRNTIGAAVPHGVGEIWAAMLWDLYWAMSEEYGWDSDIYNGTGGNNRAIQLVMDGMKIQSCNPGFIDGRDAILAADRANYGGANQCLIWEVFARRGLGFSATQGDQNDSNDAIEGYDVLPECLKELKITKTMTPSINAGDVIEVALSITNHKNETVTNLLVTDQIPEGADLIGSTLSSNGNRQGDEIQFEIPELANGTSMTIEYQLSTSNNKVSIRQFLDNGEDGDDFWLPINLDLESTNIWDLQDAISKSGEFAWHVSNPSTDSEQALQLDEEIIVSGNKPTLRFNHWHDIDPGTDGGVVEISIDFGSSWQDLGAHFIRNPYTGYIDYSVFASPDRQAFWGNSEDFKTSYIDLEDFLGETIIIRYRFGSDDDAAGSTGAFNGWFIDDIEFLDLFSYQGQACITSDQGDNACATALEGGTIVEVGELNTSVDNLEELGLQFAVFPNPAGDYFNVSLSNEKANDGIVSLFNMNGQELLQQNIKIDQITQIIPFNVRDIPGGFYFIKVQTNEGIAIKKIIIE